MRSTFFGLEVARSALQANMVALDTVGHNITNSATEGYSRQQTIMASNKPFMLPGMNKPTTAGQIGTGVHVEIIRRLRDVFADAQYRKENKFLGEAETKQKALEQVELIFNEPTDSAISGSIDQLWQAFQDLSVTPELEPVRTTVRQKALALTDALNHTYSQLEELRKDNDAEIDAVVTKINSLARQISNLNNEITRVEVSGDQANDYRDRRDLLLDELSKLVGIQTEENQFGAVSVYLQGKMLVGPTTCNQFEVKIVKVDADHEFRQVIWADTKDEVPDTSGVLSGLIQVRDKIIPELLADLDNIAVTLATNINSVHSAGYGLDGTTGIDFFASKNITNVMSTTSYVFKNDSLDFPVGTYSFDVVVNGVNKTITIDTSAGNEDSNKKILDKIAAALPAGSFSLITDSINGQTRLEINSSSPITFAAADAGSANILKKLGFISQEVTGVVAAKPKITAQYITISDDIKNSLRNIAAASSLDSSDPTKPAPADGSNALAMADIKQTKIRIGADQGAPITTINDFFNSCMAKLGVWSQEASSVAFNKEILLYGLDIRRQSVAGVNVDDEMVDMIRYQHGYSAAARLITTYNEIFDTIINRMGR